MAKLKKLEPDPWQMKLSGLCISYCRALGDRDALRCAELELALFGHFEEPSHYASASIFVSGNSPETTVENDPS